MNHYLILCRSITYAQRTAQALRHAGIGAHILRAPQSVSREGCSHCVRVGERDLSAALETLARSGLSPKHVFAPTERGEYREVVHDLP